MPGRLSRTTPLSVPRLQDRRRPLLGGAAASTQPPAIEPPAKPAAAPAPRITLVRVPA